MVFLEKNERRIDLVEWFIVTALMVTGFIMTCIHSELYWQVNGLGFQLLAFLIGYLKNG